jgi:hypothetical protein
MRQFGTPNFQSKNPFESVGTYSLTLPHICESVLEFKNIISLDFRLSYLTFGPTLELMVATHVMQ